MGHAWHIYIYTYIYICIYIYIILLIHINVLVCTWLFKAMCISIGISIGINQCQIPLSHLRRCEDGLLHLRRALARANAQSGLTKRKTNPICKSCHKHGRVTHQKWSKMEGFRWFYWNNRNGDYYMAYICQYSIEYSLYASTNVNKSRTKQCFLKELGV